VGRWEEGAEGLVEGGELSVGWEDVWEVLGEAEEFSMEAGGRIRKGSVDGLEGKDEVGATFVEVFDEASS
jgi:hypothetical protein